MNLDIENGPLRKSSIRYSGVMKAVFGSSTIDYSIVRDLK